MKKSLAESQKEANSMISLRSLKIIQIAVSSLPESWTQLEIFQQCKFPRHLKQLGFKVSAKKKMQNSGALDKLKDSSSRDLPRNAMQPNLSITNTNSSLRKPMHASVLSI